MAEMCRARGYNVKLAGLDEVEVEELPEHKNVLLMIATCGEGALPQNSQAMWEQLNNRDLPPTALEGLNFSVFALGDRNYHHFCKAGYDFERRFGELGARRVLPMGIGDDQDEDKFETGWSEFLPSYWSTMGAPPDPTEHLIPTPAFVMSQVPPREVLPNHRAMPPRSKLVDITFNDRITPRDYDRSIRHIEFDLAPSGINYLLGDALTIYPTNDPTTVAAFLDFYGLDGDQAVSITPSGNAMPDERKNEMFEQPLFLRQVFEEVLDVLGRPSKAFLKQLAKFASDPKEKAELEELVSEEGGEKYASEIAAETLTFFDLLKRYPSAKPSVEHLLTLLPCIKARLYTIASSSRAFPGKCRLTVVINDWDTPSGKRQVGLCTDYLERIGEAGVPVQAACTMTAGTFNFPESNETPMVMVGLGTGVAPFIAFAQDRRWRRDRGEKNGPMWLFYGCRHKAKDYILGDTLEALEEEGILTQLRPAFSRDTAKKVYVQNRMVEEPEKIYEDLITRGGYFYLCGQAGQLELDVKAALVECFEKGGGVSKREGEKLLNKLIEEGRYCVELY
jgi:sulfite reductase alpha subunit-like flavoprotein